VSIRYRFAVIGALAAVLAACSTTPAGSEGSQAQTERVCFDQESSSGSRLSRRVCRTVEKEPEQKAEPASEG
tara:strand:- start:490 stop:705 length:216 start_codon:yes stop_codon:yes gene_type:complete